METKKKLTFEEVKHLVQTLTPEQRNEYQVPGHSWLFENTGWTHDELLDEIASPSFKLKNGDRVCVTASITAHFADGTTETKPIKVSPEMIRVVKKGEE